jgi:uncharacterized protein YndB with AHSA1/START domain
MGAEKQGHDGSFTANASVSIRAPATKVWRALVDPEMIKAYLFGTTVESDWKVGSPITYRGVWQGNAYEDKGRIIEMVEGSLLKSTYWSSMSGAQDTPENYSTITYTLKEGDGGTVVELSQDNNPSRESADHSEANWKMVLKTMKEMLEK